MSNKSTIKENTKNSVFTPEDVKEALDSLPFNYIVQTQEILQKKVEAGDLKKNFSKTWITKVKDGDEFNEHVLEALVEVGKAEIDKRARFGLKKEKTPSTN